MINKFFKMYKLLVLLQYTKKNSPFNPIFFKKNPNIAELEIHLSVSN